MLVLEAAQGIASGMDLSTVAEALNQSIKKTHIYVCLETFRYAIKSGRVPKSLGNLAMFFGARPIMTLDASGKGAAFGMGFSQRQITKKILQLMAKINQSQGILTYSIVHAGNPGLAHIYANSLEKSIGFPPAFITEISTVTAIHSGIGSVAVSLISK